MKKRRAPYKKVTLADVAQAARVSPTTVSRVINSPQMVDETTRQAVHRAMDDLGYIYSKGSAAGAPVQISSRKGIVAVMIPNDENPFYLTFIRMIERALAKEGYLLLLCVFNNDSSSIEAHMENLMRQKVNGCIMAYLRLDEQSGVVTRFLRTIPCVSFQSGIEHADAVAAEERSGTYAMLERLVRYGHKKIGFVGYYSNISAFEERFGAYREIHERFNLPLRNEYISEAPGALAMDFQTSYREGCRLLSLPDRPTAIHCFNLKSAMGVYVAIREMRLRIPEDISLSAFDDLQVAQIFTPPLSVVGVPLQAMISAAVDFLIKRIQNENKGQLQRISFPSNTHFRASIGPAPD